MKKIDIQEKRELQARKAQLESMHDHLLTELTYVDNLLRLVGFSGGLATVKATAREMAEIKEEEQENHEQNDEEMSA